jgi:hypothetical protein
MHMKLVNADDEYARTLAQVMGHAQSSRHEGRFDHLWTFFIQQYDNAVSALLSRYP